MRSNFWLTALYRLIVTAWVGMTWTIGLVAAPLAFAVLEPRSQAGTFASHAFYWQSITAMVCGALVLLLHRLVERRLGLSRPLFYVVLAIVALAALQQLLLSPILANLRVEMMSAVSETAREALASRFGMLHGVSSVMYLTQCVLGAVLVVRGR
jgi:hypothetical protein